MKKKIKKSVKKQPKTTIPSGCACRKKEANRILKANMEGSEKLNEASDLLFAKNFLMALLKEQEEIESEEIKTSDDAPSGPEDFTPERNQEDFEKSLEPETDAENFDIEGISSDITLETINKVKEWAIKLADFEKFLNNPSDDSLHRILADNDRAGSLLRGITRKASDSITRIAGEIAKLKEVLNTFVNTAPKKVRDLSDQRGTI